MGFPRYNLRGERRVPGSQQGPCGTPHSPGLCLETPHSSSTTQPCQASTIPVSAEATHPRGFQCYGAIPTSSHPPPAPCASVAACAVPRGLQAGHCVQGTRAACGAQDNPPAPGRCCAQGRMPRYRVPVGAGSPGELSQAREPAGAGAARRLGRVPSSVRSRQPGQHVPSTRAHAVGRGEACRGTSQIRVHGASVQLSEAAGTARDTGCCRGVRLGLRALAELSQAWDNKQDHHPRGWTEPSAGAGPTHQKLSSF